MRDSLDEGGGVGYRFIIRPWWSVVQMIVPHRGEERK
jgi:hypothetical protein